LYLERLDLKAECNRLTEQEKELRCDLERRIFEGEKKRIMDIKQKARVNWALSGDENSKFFHSSLKSNRRRNQILGLSVNGIWTTSPSEVKQAAFNYFAEKFKEPLLVRPAFSSSRFKVLSVEQNTFLEAPFVDSEIRNAVWDCDGEKAQGPDGSQN